MTPHNPYDTQRSIDERAATWLLTLQSEELSAAQRAEFVDWLRESPQHIAKMLRMCQMQRNLSTFQGWARVSQLERTEPVEPLALLSGLRPSAVRPRSHRMRNAFLLAASIAVLCVVGAPLLSRIGQTEFRTQPGERREVTLADGSIVDLAPASDLLVKYRQRERLITLNNGEALFHVAKNPSRPFVVQASTTQIRAVGTVFNVERGAQGVSVTVVEGRVAVSQQNMARSGNSAVEPDAPTLGLGANEQVSIAPNGVPSKVRSIAAEAGVGWNADQIIFDDETVAEVARRFNIHNQMKIDILDSKLAERRVSGVFQTNDPQSFVTFIEAAANAQVSQRDATHIVVGTDTSRAP